MKDAPREGIYYVIRWPAGWELVVNRFKQDTDTSHPVWFESTLAPKLAQVWAVKLGISREEIEERIKNLPYAFPRGRVVVGEDESFIYNGADLTPDMKVKKFMVEEAFDITGLFYWKFDEHEQCLWEDKENIRQFLGIKEDWKADY